MTVSVSGSCSRLHGCPPREEKDLPGNLSEIHEAGAGSISRKLDLFLDT